jgi:hypothetical protein
MKEFVMLGLAACGILICSLINGCMLSPAYLVATRITQDKTELARSVPELTKREDILKIAEETGKSLGYQSTGVFSTSHFNGLTLKVSSDSEAKTLLLPGGTKARIRVTCPTSKGLAEFKKKSVAEKFDEKTYQKMTTLYIELEYVGYWGAGGKEEAERIFNDFIDKFLERARVTGI